MAYARHQSFYIRDKWFSKGLKAVKEKSRFFLIEDSFENIGLGKNMVDALKYWLFSFGVLEERNDEGQRGHYLTELGTILYESDKFLQKLETLAILHFHLVRNSEDQSTVFDWFFNKFKETSVSKPDLVSSFNTWVSENEPKTVSEKSLKRDIDCLIQFYTKSPNTNDPEDLIFCPFSKLLLLQVEPSGESSDIIKKRVPDIEKIGVTPLYYVLLNYSVLNETDLISIDEILNSENLWGKTYNLSRNKVIEALNFLTAHDKYPIEYVRTNNLDYIKIPRISPLEFLKKELLKG